MSFLYAVKGEIGTESNPLTTTADISNNAFNGFQTLFVDFGGELNNPIEVEMLFGETDGPWYVFSFDFVDAGGNAEINRTASFAGRDDWYDKSSFGNAQLGLGDSTDSYLDKWHPSHRVDNNDSGVFVTSNAPFDLENQEIDYFNHATQSNLSESEENALRNHVTSISDKTPHMGSTSDDDSDDNIAYDDNGSGKSSNSNGHLVFIDADGFTMCPTPVQLDQSETVTLQLWTENSYQVEANNSLGGVVPQSSDGISDISSKLLIPDNVNHYTNTGGGSGFGTPYSQNLNPVSDNFRNNRTFFLVKD